jgi:hypothetical protein
VGAVARLQAYRGPVCPRCNGPLDLESLRDGEDICPNCSGFFELRVFHPPKRVAHVAAVDTGVDTATPCANHPRNSAVANCQRCGVFICSLCELEIGGGRYCPACFDRLSQEGTLPAALLRFRDYASLAMSTAVLGLIGFFALGIPLGILSLYYSVRAFRDPNTERSSRGTIVLAILFALVDIPLGTLILWALFKTPRPVAR